MSVSGSSESSDAKIENLLDSSNVKNRYALYLFSNKKHCSTSETSNNLKGNTLEIDAKSSEVDEPTFCLSLLEGNLDADLETVLRCYLLKSVPVHEDLTFENEGKYTVLQSSDISDEAYGCYYQRLKTFDDSVKQECLQHEKLLKYYIFFICLIGPANGIMESYKILKFAIFCPELGTFCCSLIPLLDPEGLRNQEHMQSKLKSWYYYCVEYVSRCIKNFKEELVEALHCSLWGNVKIISSDKEIVWDLERFVETCSLMPKCIVGEKDTIPIDLKVIDGKIIVDRKFGRSQYCTRWYEKLKNCFPEDHSALHSILESFRLKTIQDLNTLKRLVQKAETDHYALFRAYHFLKSSGYENVLLFHVKREASVAKEMSTIDVITCLQDFIASNSCD